MKQEEEEKEELEEEGKPVEEEEEKEEKQKKQEVEAAFPFLLSTGLAARVSWLGLSWGRKQINQP